MSIPSSRLLAHLCCTCLLLLSVICIISATPTRITSNTAARVDLENNSSNFDLSGKKDKCQFNLTDSSQSLEAKSSIYQHLGFSKCEYIIQAPSSHFLLLSFTDIHSQSDMSLETSVRHQDFLQAATYTTTTKSVFTKSSLINVLSHKKVNSSSIHLNRELVANSSRDTDFTSPSNLQNNSQHNTSGSNSNSYTGKPVQSKTLSDDHIEEHIISKNSIKNSNKDTNVVSRTVESTTVSESSDVDLHTGPRVLSCSLKFIIEEVNSASGSAPQVICWEKAWQHRIPLVFQYSAPIRITYVWDRHSQSGFSLDFRFLRPDAEVDCLFRCNSYLCLPKKQLCDGFNDCPNHSDEHSSTCVLARQQQESGETHVIVIIFAVILGIILIPAVIFMISHIRCRNGACRRGDSLLQPPHSQSSEVCRSPSGSMQESGHYETLLHQHTQRQTAVPSLMVPSLWCMERQQLLQQQQHHEPEQHQQNHQLLSLNHHKSQEHLLCPISSEAGSAMTPETSSGSQKYGHQQQLTYHQQQHIEQQLQHQRKHRHALKHENPDELYPPNIPLSADGEEGYAMSQKVLHSKQQLERNRQVENEVFRAPPNKTVYDRDSPPPPYSLSPPRTHILDCHYSSVGVGRILRQVRSSLTTQGSPSEVPQSHSLSCHH